MPSWKKIITSGSSALLLNVTASSFTGSFTGSFSGTGSYATNALSASYAPGGAAFPFTGSAKITGSLVVTGSITSTDTITAGLDVTANQNLKSMYQAGDEGGEINLNVPVTNTSLAVNVTIDVHQNKLRIFEGGGSNRGGYFDISSLAPSAGTDLNPSGYTGTVTIFANPPGQQNLNFTNGVLISVT
jgi:hypothetical protein